MLPCKRGHLLLRSRFQRVTVTPCYPVIRSSVHHLAHFPGRPRNWLFFKQSLGMYVQLVARQPAFPSPWSTAHPVGLTLKNFRSFILNSIFRTWMVRPHPVTVDEPACHLVTGSSRLPGSASASPHPGTALPANLVHLKPVTYCHSTLSPFHLVA